MAHKIIVLGEPNGQFQAVFKKLSTLHAKNNFAFAIVTGNLFAADDDEALSELLEGKIEVPVSTYFTVGSKELPQRVFDKLSKDEDVCENLHFLGKRSTTKTSDGIRIVTLGGMLDEKIVAGTSKEQHLPFHTVDDAKALKGAKSADILLTAAWPANIRNGSVIPKNDAYTEPPSLDHISELCKTLKPRYHLSSSPEFFFEREPFFHSVEGTPTAHPVTRFISLAANGNTTKQKSVYAFSLQEIVDPTAALPPGTTISPFSPPSGPRQGKRQPLEQDPFRYSNGAGSDRRFKRRTQQIRPDECFFCLSNPDIGTHLIVAIGDDSYLTLAKGPLIESSTNADMGLDFPAHGLIIPLTHEPTLALVPQDAREKTYLEMLRFKTALQTMVSIRSVNKLGAVTYEISRGSIRHTHWQFLPMPLAVLDLVEAGFRVEAENLQYPPFKVKDVGIGELVADFFRVWIWWPPADDEDGNEGTTKCLFFPIETDARFDLQFGRRVLAKLLGLEKRLQWRDCTQDPEAEGAEAEAFKSAFNPYDFTITG